MFEYIVDRLGQLGDGIIDSPNGEIFAPFTLQENILKEMSKTAELILQKLLNLFLIE